MRGVVRPDVEQHAEVAALLEVGTSAIRIVFRPIIELATGRAGGYEALRASTRSRRAGLATGSLGRTASGSARSCAVCAEGVEDLDDVRTLVALDVTYAQGYALARPGPAWPAPEATAAGAPEIHVGLRLVLCGGRELALREIYRRLPQASRPVRSTARACWPSSSAPSSTASHP